ncbi:MAG TPA: bifunctional 23S rRNA (guanine(2069)-N(7))-methyltransferase RlmK/23S rRNA (guanine(2445)-N(2))-methyltransferase RlmL, partial [Steroidobacteraceae bacterium]|nr:bifunctional 23S rRNA (guanine(2069)-N(7))-methyltransferase RlmK/23S rRNA (guanine(2445)-N(2))-methyltransferase RlmL [Steroidobacteraceae bacterium]
CLESRLANRIFLELASFEAATTEEFYAGVRRIDWTAHLGPGATLACEFTGRHPAITHTHFGTLKLKDAIVDAVREATGERPDIAVEQPDVRVHAHANGARITVSLDLSGESLHRRGYRGAAGEAPLKENVAAGILLRAGWQEMAAAGAPFLDPMCGSGTLVIEAAWIAAGHAPGLSRSYYGFLGWRAHDTRAWNEVLEQARARSRIGADLPVIIRGQDRDGSAIRIARDNAERAGVSHLVQFEVKPLAQAAPPDMDSGVTGAPPTPGLICVNPPYGVRLEDHAGAMAVHRELGEVLRTRFQGWSAAVLIGAPELGKELGIRAYRTHALWNGALECRLLRLRIDAQSARDPGRLGKPDASLRESPGARMFANRLGKNLKRLKSWADREGVSCYRLYDADMPEYAFAIDFYRTIEPDGAWLYVQEYAAPTEIELDAVRRRRNEALSVLPEVTGVAPECIQVRTRRRTRHGDQYQKVAEREHFHRVMEGGLKFRVNFDDYLDTGLFLDHRMTRERLRAASRGKRFLNLFAYTGTATVYAASGGATSTTTVDLSRTYLDWTQVNLSLNHLIGPQHQLIQADCREWLQQAAAASGPYDVIFLDPPTFSNSKRMEGVLDIERDHPVLIDACVRLLSEDGLLVFSTNAQRFRLDEPLAGRHDVRDISAATLPRDFERNPRIHRCFEIRRRPMSQ